jgi:hypothetical protein
MTIEPTRDQRARHPMTKSAMRLALTAWCAAACWGACALGDGPKFTLIDDALQQSLVSEPSGPTLGPRAELIYSDARGVPRELAVAKVVALAPAWWNDAQAKVQGEVTANTGVGTLILTDGQRLPGVLSPVEAPAESLAWEHPRLGRVVVPLERVSEIELPDFAAMREARSAAAAARENEPGGREAPPRPRAEPRPLAPPPADRSKDVVEFANGDRLTGLVEKVGSEVVVSGTGTGSASPGGPAKSTSVAIANVRRMWLANPGAAPGGSMVWLTDGTVVAAKGLTINPGEPLRLGDWVGAGMPAASEGGVGQGAGPGGAAPYTVEDIAAVAFSPKRLRALADLTIRSQEAAPGRKLVRGVRVSDDALRSRAMPAPLATRDVEIPGPMSVEFALPAGATRVSATIELPEASWTWGDCRVKVESLGGTGAAGAVLLDAHLNSETPAAKLAGVIPAGSSALRISVDAGERGPVQDRVLVRRGLVLLGP